MWKQSKGGKNSVLPEDLQVTRGISVPLFIIKIIRQQLCQIASSVGSIDLLFVELALDHQFYYFVFHMSFSLLIKYKRHYDRVLKQSPRYLSQE